MNQLTSKKIKLQISILPHKVFNNGEKLWWCNFNDAILKSWKIFKFESLTKSSLFLFSSSIKPFSTLDYSSVSRNTKPTQPSSPPSSKIAPSSSSSFEWVFKFLIFRVECLCVEFFFSPTRLRVKNMRPIFRSVVNWVVRAKQQSYGVLVPGPESEQASLTCDISEQEKFSHYLKKGFRCFYVLD